METTTATDLVDADILLTGATGRVGQRLATALIERGARVRTVVLPGDPGLAFVPSEVRIITGSLTDAATVDDALKDANAVIHLAALMDWSEQADDKLFDANIRATYLLLERAARRADTFTRFVVVSSDEVYPALDVAGEITEDLPLTPYSFYGLTKQVDELLGEFYRRVHGLPVTTVRFALTAAPDEIARADGWSGRLFFASGLRTLLSASGRAEAVQMLDSAVTDQDRTLVLARNEAGEPYVFQFCDVRDLVHGIQCLLTAPSAIGQTFNLSGPESFSYSEVVPRLSEALDVPFVELHLPGERFNVRTDISRARQLIDYSPQHGITEILHGLGDRQVS